MDKIRCLKGRTKTVLACLAVCLAAAARLPAKDTLEERVAQGLLNAASNLEQSGQNEEAVNILLPHREDLRILRRLYALYLKMDRQMDFLPLVREACVAQPDDSGVLELYLLTLAGLGLPDSLLVEGRRFVERAPGKAESYLWVGARFRSAGLIREALELFREGRKRLGDQTLFRREISDLLIDQADYGPALEEMLAALRTDTGNLPVVQVQAYRILKDKQRGGPVLVGAFEKALPGAEGLHLVALLRLLLDIDLTLGRTGQALAALSEYARRLDKNPALVETRIFITRSRKLGYLEAALQAYGIADSLGLITGYPLLMAKADLYLEMGDATRAEETLVTLSQDKSQDRFKLEAIARLASLYLDRLNRPDKALQWYRVLQNFPGQDTRQLAAVKLKIARSFIRLGQLDHARQVCNELGSAEEKFQQDLSALLCLADIFFYQGLVDTAAQYYLFFAEHRLGEPEANDALERAYLIRNDPSPGSGTSKAVGQALFQALQGKLQQATEIFQQTLAQAPDTTSRVMVLYQMGRMYESAGDFPLALGTYEQIASQFPAHHLAPVARLRMGIILLGPVGDSKRARGCLESVVLDFPEGAATPVARRLLRELEEKTP